jgi:lysozyme
MQTSESGRDLIKRFEGEILKVYLDPISLPTLGVGHLLTKAELNRYPVGTPISRELSDEFLRKDLERFERGVSQLVTSPTTQNQFDAMLSLAFNIGLTNFQKSSVLRYHNEGRYSAAANSFLLWNKAGGKVLNGLVRRRKAERELYVAE